MNLLEPTAAVIHNLFRAELLPIAVQRLHLPPVRLYALRIDAVSEGSKRS
jgi:hypothetical protein